MMLGESRIIPRNNKERKEVALISKRQEVKEVFDIILHQKLNDGEYFQLTGQESNSFVKNQNVDVQTRIGLAIAQNAMQGDVKSAEFIMKYSGNEPIKEAKVQLEMPMIINDLPQEVKNITEEVVLEDNGTLFLEDTEEKDELDEFGVKVASEPLFDEDE